jgi:uncharacterized membrane protein YbhN (UPF0104 family)
MNKRVSILLQYLFFLSLGIFLVWWSVKDIDRQKWQEIRLALANARFYLGIPVFIILLLSHFVRALRWRLLIEPMGYKPDKANTFFAVMIGYLANQAFPRLGEVLKCTLFLTKKYRLINRRLPHSREPLMLFLCHGGLALH